MKLYFKFLCILSTVLLFIHQFDALPDLNSTSREPVITVPGADAYLSCKVKDLGNHTVLFRKLDTFTATDLEGDLLTVGNLSLRDDNRYQVLHERRHDIWLLKIRNVTEDDSGIYICEVNSKPKKKITRLLKIVKESPLINIESDEDGSPPIALHEISHNYSNCCISNNVPSSCLDYCEFSQLVQNNKQGSFGSPKMCFNHIGSITKCLTDGRNHLPCCVQNHIPKVCWPICEGNFSLTAVTDYFTCMEYVAPLLACVGKGIKILPPKPLDLIVEPNTESLIVKWSKPEMDSNLINYYLLNVTQLHSFDEVPGQSIRNKVISIEEDKKINKNSSETPSMFGLQLSYKVNGSLTEFHLFNLKPFTIYELVMSSHNKFGSSLPTEIIRTVTLASDSKPKIDQNRTSNRNSTVNSDSNNSTSVSKELPDIKGCCRKSGVTINRCIDIMCDPVRADETTLTDIMICAPYANVTFKCMAQSVDHRPCCLNKGVPVLCAGFCDGKINKLDFRHFICLRHMSSYQSCILDHYGVLPSEPIDFHVTSVHHNWAILRWKSPTKNKDTIKEYHVYYRESLKDKPNIFNRTVTQFAPFLLDGLNANSRYEVYVSAVNQYGISGGSNRVIFFTPPIVESNKDDDSIAPNNKDIILDKNNLAYNETECCVNAKLAKHCMPLCSYQMKITDVLNLAPKCGDQMSALVRCGTGGRNHIPCCQRRQVSESCLNLCAGIVETSPMIIARSCSSDLGKILRCMEEGTGNIPGMPQDLHAIKVTDSSVQLLWKSAEEDRSNTLITYQVRYGKVDPDKPLHPLEHNQSLNTSYPNAMLTGLEKGVVYSIYVVAANSFGISLPSLVLLVNTTEDARGLIKSGVGAPHALEVIYQNVDSITFSWLPPLFIPPDTSVTYIVNYKTINGTELDYIPTVKDKWIKVETRFNTMIITNLTYNTQYAIGVQAKVVYNKDDKEKNKIEISPLSEMILVWTDPAIPAAVNLPVTIPAGPIIEGHNLTALCVCSGNPTPTLSIYINGVLVKREEKRHLTYTITNIQRQVSSITCYAINGYGNDMQSSQSTLEVKVRFKPSINMNNNDEELTNSLNSTARLQCEVSGNPQPQVTWHKQKKGFDIVQFTDNIDIISTPHNEMPFTWINTLLIKKISEDDKGKYLCEANNVLGKANKIIDLNVDTTKINDRNYTDCCERENVSSACMKVCHFDIDIQLATTIPACYNDLDKLMFCAADGSDHRACCRRNQVPAGCVQWCRGSKATSKREQSAVYCALAASPTIVKCFQEGSALLPGPVHQLELTRFTKENNTAEVHWSLPTKNPELVQYYKVYFRPIGSKDLTINVTNSTTFELINLDTSKLYEFVVKAGNSMGLSIFSEPLVIGFNEYSKSIKNSLASSEMGLFNTVTAIGRVLANLLSFAMIIGLISGAIYYVYDRFSYKIKPPPGAVSFDNPSYMTSSSYTKETGSVSFSNNNKKIDVTHMDNLNNNDQQTDLNDQDDKQNFFK